MKRRAIPRKPVLMSGAIEFAGGTITHSNLIAKRERLLTDLLHAGMPE
jgi:hypothetical protein